VVELDALPARAIAVDAEHAGVLHSDTLIEMASHGGSRSKSGADPQP